MATLSRWTEGKPFGVNYFYDEPLPDIEILDKNNAAHADHFPPMNIDLSDAWVAKIVQSTLEPKERNSRYPLVFTKESITSGYRNKGMASKAMDLSSKRWHYNVVFGNFQLGGEEGNTQKLSGKIDRKSTKKKDITLGVKCLVQNNDYAPHGTATSENAATPKKATPSVATAKRSGTSEASQVIKRRKTGVTSRSISSLIPLDSDEEEEVQQDTSPTKVASLHKKLAASRDEIVLLHQRIAACETKGMALAEATEKIYRVLNPGVQKFAVDTGNALKVAAKSNPGISESRKHFFKSLRKLIQPADDAVAEFKDLYPKLSSLLFMPGQADGPSDDFIQWRDAGSFLEGDGTSDEQVKVAESAKGKEKKFVSVDKTAKGKQKEAVPEESGSDA